jgi:hypothetical protein
VAIIGPLPWLDVVSTYKRDRSPSTALGWRRNADTHDCVESTDADRIGPLRDAVIWELVASAIGHFRSAGIRIRVSKTVARSITKPGRSEAVEPRE